MKKKLFSVVFALALLLCVGITNSVQANRDYHEGMIEISLGGGTYFIPWSWCEGAGQICLDDVSVSPE